MRENLTGKKVWLNVNGMLDKSKEWLVVMLLERGDNNDDWCDHYIVEDACGIKKDIREIECLVVPNTELEEDDMVNNFLSDNDLDFNDVYTYGKNVHVVIYSGDWKHSHGYCDYLMTALGYSLKNILYLDGTENNGEDWYSAERIYVKFA